MPAADRLKARKRPRQARSRDTVDVILRAAAQVFATRGYAATTTNHIAARAGVSIGVALRVLPEQGRLLVALMEAPPGRGRSDPRARRRRRHGGGGDDLEQVVRYFVEGMVTFHERDRALHRVLFEEAPFPRHVRKRLGDIEARVVSLVEQFLRAPSERHDGAIRALGAAVVVHAVEALTHKLVVHATPAVSVEACDRRRWRSS